ncbi:MAG: Asp-tRNA(Asn)/Glu-tRNA(Gln) amidotransferase subunit GatA [Candidatus Omnitrophota bacterium]
MRDELSCIDVCRKWLEEKPEISSRFVRDLLAHIKRIDQDIKAFAFIDERRVTERAAKIEKLPRDKELRGVPVGIKNNICIKGSLTTCCSRMLETFRPVYDAHVIEKLYSEGALVIEGLNMDEFAFGSSCETSCYGPTRNPIDTSRIPGGSSGGAAAAVRAGEVAASIGSDTGGSIRQPASMCGVVGLKPTYGRVSRYGLIAFASSLDQIGPITRNVADSALMLEVLSGYDKRDSTSVKIDVPKYTESLGKDIKGVRIGVPREYFLEGISSGVRRRVEEAIDVLRELGAEIKDVSLPHTKYAVSCYYIIAPAEASSNLARYDGAQYGYRAKNPADMTDMYISSRNEAFGEEVKRRILLGTYSLSSGYYGEYYLKAQKVRTRISEDFHSAFKQCDCLVTPTSPTTAFGIGEKTMSPIEMYLSDIFTIPANLAGIPAMSVPCGIAENDMPVGLQIMAGPFREEVLMKVAHAFERSSGHEEKLRV